MAAVVAIDAARRARCVGSLGTAIGIDWDMMDISGLKDVMNALS